MSSAHNLRPLVLRSFDAPRGAACAGTVARFLMLAFAAGCAAVFAHGIIDALGDVLLPRDAYDGVAHQSRALVIAASALLALGAALAALWNVLDGAHSRESLQAFRSALAGRSSLLGVATVAAATVAILISMEAFDALAQGVTISDFDDLLGGSLALGLGVALSLGALAGFVARAALSWLVSSHRALAVALSALLFALAPRMRDGGMYALRLRRPRRVADTWLIALRSGKRGPPSAVLVPARSPN